MKSCNPWERPRRFFISGSCSFSLKAESAGSVIDGFNCWAGSPVFGEISVSSGSDLVVLPVSLLPLLGVEWKPGVERPGTVKPRPLLDETTGSVTAPVTDGREAWLVTTISG